MMSGVMIRPSDSQPSKAELKSSAVVTNGGNVTHNSEKNVNATSNTVGNLSASNGPVVRTLQKPETVNLMAMSGPKVPNKMALSASAGTTGEKKLIDIEELKNLTGTENVAKSVESRSRQILDAVAKGQKANMVVNSFNPPNSARQMSFDANSLPVLLVPNKTSNATSESAFSPSTSPSKVNRSSFIAPYKGSAASAAADVHLTSVSICDTCAFMGLSVLDNPENQYWHPPDISVAAGPNHVVEMVNNMLEVWDKNGNPVIGDDGNPVIRDLFTMFRTGNPDVSGGHLITDPKIIFDRFSGRWFASIMDEGLIVPTEKNRYNHDCMADDTHCTVKVAVSTSGNPAAGWKVFTFPSGDERWDQPIIAVNDDKLVISVNVEGQEALVVAADKVSMINGNPPRWVETSGSIPDDFSIHPAQLLSDSPCIYLVSVTHKDTDLLRLSSVCGNKSSGNLSFNHDIAIIRMHPPKLSPINGTQPNGKPINTEDGRMLTAVYYNGRIWDGFNDACTPKGTTEAQACARIQEIDVDNQKILFDNYIVGKPPTISDTYYPALTVNSEGRMVFATGTSKSSIDLNPSILLGDQSSVIAFLLRGDTSTIDDRYGDYSAAAIDTDGKSMWIGFEYINNEKFWSSVIAHISYR